MVELASQPLVLDDSSSSFSCPQCPKIFSNQKLLAQHQHMFHTDKSFVCEICGKAFRFRSNLAEHRSVHTALKPYVCKYCGKSSRLKGNLTKHILKHHKKEQAEQVSKDDIIIKKEPSASDLLEKSMLVLQQQSTPSNVDLVSFLPKEEKSDPDYERAIFLSFGLDQGSMDLSGSPEVVSENGTDLGNGSHDIESESPSPVPNTTVGGATSLQALLQQVSAENTPPRTVTPSSSIFNGTPLKTQCLECGKHFRKGSALQLHMTLNHGCPPPASSASSNDEKTSEDTEGDMAVLQHELRTVKGMLTDPSASHRLSSIEQAVHSLEQRMGKLEKNVDTVLNSMYSLVQLQTGLNTAVTRFRDEMTEQFKIMNTTTKNT